MNDFIVNSDFWDTFDNELYFKDKGMCIHCNGGSYQNYHTKKEKVHARIMPSGEIVNFIGERAYCNKCGHPMHASAVDKQNLKKIQVQYPDVTYLVYGDAI